jgi:hypothetical protein
VSGAAASSAAELTVAVVDLDAAPPETMPEVRP